ncbi:unnamed protein product [Penicillium manginii]
MTGMKTTLYTNHVGVIRAASPTNQHSLIDRWGEVIPFQYWAEHCYEKYGGWRHGYEPCEYYCFKCLASLEGWDAEYEEVCEYLETLSEESEDGSDEFDLDELDSDTSD